VTEHKLKFVTCSWQWITH